MAANAATPITFNQPAQTARLPEDIGSGPGAFIQSASDTVRQFGEARISLKNDTDLTNAKVALVGKLQDLTQSFRADSDPATASDRFTQQAQKIAADLGGNFGGDWANRWNAESNDLVLSHRSAVSEMAWQKQKSDAAGTIDQASETMSRTAAYAPNAEVRAAAIKSFGDTVNSFVAQGLYDQKGGEHLVQGFKEHLAQFDAENAIDKDPAAAAAALRNPGTLPELDPLTRMQMIGRADAAVRQAEAEQRRAAADARREAREQMRDLREQARFAVQDFNTVAASGKPPAQTVLDQTTALVQRANDPTITHEYVATLRGVQAVQQTQGMNAQQIMAEIAQNNADIAKHGGNDIDHAVVSKMLNARLDHVTSQASADPLKLASDEGVIKLAPLALDGSDNPAAVKARIAQADRVASQYHIAPRYLTAAEEQQLKTQVAPDADPNAKLAALSHVLANFGTRAPSVLAHISNDAPVAAHVGGLLLSGGDRTAARDALTGEKLIASKAADEYTPTLGVKAAKTDARSHWFSSTITQPTGAPNVSRALAYMPQDFARASATADAIYTARAQKMGLTKASLQADPTPGEQLYDQAINLALGAHYAANGQRRGGLSSYRGYPVVVGEHVNPDFFDDAMHALTGDDIKSASATGAAPKPGYLAGDHPLANAWLVSAGDGRYFISTKDPAAGAAQFVPDAKGRPFQLSVSPALFARLSQRGVKQP